MEKYGTNEQRRKKTNYHLLVDKWVLIEGPDQVDHDFTFLENTVSIPIIRGEMKLSAWMCYLATVHEEIKITPMEG